MDLTLGFVIPVRNDAARLERCLESIASASSRPDCPIIVADNGSVDDSPAVAARAGATVLSLPGRRVAELRNVAAATLEVDAIAFVDADHELGPGWLHAALEDIGRDRVGAVGALYSSPALGTWVQRAYGALRGHTRGCQDVEWLGSGNLVVRRSAFEAIGGFDSSLHACEDVDLCQRLTRAGWRVLGDERLGSVHHGDPKTLMDLYRAERWRGHDNLRVTFRGRPSFRSLVSALIPVADLAALVIVCAGLVIAPFDGLGVLLVGTGTSTFLVPALARASRILARTDRSLRPTAWQMLILLLVYDLARAVALVTPARHHGRQPRVGRAPGTESAV